MSIKIYTCNSEVDSVRSLGFDVSVEIGGNYAPSFSNDCVIRWGNSRRIYNNASDKNNGIVSEFPNVINSGKAIKANLNKLRSIEVMSTIVKTPKTFTFEVPEGVKAVIRPLEHSGGAEFNLVTGPYEIQEGYYGVEFLETDSEFRCWFINGKTLVGRRVATTEEQRRQAPCRSKWGYEYIHSEFAKLREQTLKAAKLLGIEVGASDVLKVGNEYVFLEINTAVSCDTNTVREFYKAGINEYARQKFPRLFQVRPEVVAPIRRATPVAHSRMNRSNFNYYSPAPR
jgi:hypothetical protein